MTPDQGIKPIPKLESKERISAVESLTAHQAIRLPDGIAIHYHRHRRRQGKGSSDWVRITGVNGEDFNIEGTRLLQSGYYENQWEGYVEKKYQIPGYGRLPTLVTNRFEVKLDCVSGEAKTLRLQISPPPDLEAVQRFDKVTNSKVDSRLVLGLPGEGAVGE